MLLAGLARGLAGDKVGLEAYAVDADASGFELRDDFLGGAGFGAGELDIVVVVVEFYVCRGGSGRGGEGDGNVGGADGVVPERGAVGAVIGEGFIHDVPGVAAGAPVSDDGFDVVGHDGDEGCVVPGLGGEPGGEGVIPDQIVTADELAVSFGNG